MKLTTPSCYLSVYCCDCDGPVIKNNLGHSGEMGEILRPVREHLEANPTHRVEVTIDGEWLASL